MRRMPLRVALRRVKGRFFHGYYDCYCYLPLYVFCGPASAGCKASIGEAGCSRWRSQGAAAKAISSSRAKPLSARNRMRTCGQDPLRARDIDRTRESSLGKLSSAS
jgi:hypothetical protein